MKTSNTGVQFIKSYEGFRSHVYVCPAGVPTIGYGHTKGVTLLTSPVTEAEAEKLLREDLADAEKTINRLRVKLTQGQFDALVSFVFNLGSGAFASSTLLKKLIAGEMVEAAMEFPKWNMAGGKRSRGLLRRRLNEALMFLD